MSLLSLKPPFLEAKPRETEQRLEWLMQSILGNRFLPEPEAGRIFVGDGDFRTIGAEYLAHLVRLGGIKPQDRVLDIGSGIGRLAVPLTQYLDPTASYLGLDPAREGIDWCQSAITPVYPSFRFRHLDVAHEIYNPDGLKRGDSLVLPVGDRSISFAFMVSVVTHLPPNEVMVYAREVARVLAPGGRFLVTSFIMDETARASGSKDPRCSFQRSPAGPAWHIDPDAPFGAVAFDNDWLDELPRAGWPESRAAQSRPLARRAGFALPGHHRGSQAGREHLMRILVLAHNHPDLHPGGTEIFAHDLFHAYKRQGVEALFVAATNNLHREQRPGTSFQTIGPSGDEVVVWAGHFDRFYMSQTDSYGTMQDMARLLEDYRPDVLHLHHLLLVGAELPFLARRVLPNAEIVLTLHDYYPDLPSRRPDGAHRHQ